MKIDLPEKTWEKIIDTIENLERIDFSEITDGNKSSELFGIISNLSDFKFDLWEEMDQ